MTLHRFRSWITFTPLLPALLLAACASSSAPPAPTGTQDARITAAVRSAIEQQSELNVSELTVRTSQGVVELRGYVRTPDAASAVAMVARTVEGVRSVSNELRLK